MPAVRPQSHISPSAGAPLTAFPKKGQAWPALEQKLQSFKSLDFDWRGGRLPSYTYFYNDDLLNVQMEAYRLYAAENSLGQGRAFKSISSMIADIEVMSCDLFHAPEGAGMTFTTGGTESIFEAVKTARNYYRSVNGTSFGTRLNLVAPVSAHAALNKAAEIMDIEVRRVAVGPERRADPEAMLERIDTNTIMVFASAPAYPYGVMDPIAKIGAVAKARNLWFHVDACWGGFISPFAKALGYELPLWDMEVEGVTSLSADIHKFGYGAKGASVLLFRDGRMREFERFEFSGWPRGTYSTPSFMGTSPAGAVAAAWAVMQYLGFEGYLETTRLAMDATSRLIDGVNAIPGLRCLEPNREANLFAYTSIDPDVDIIAVADALERNGWLRGQLREPFAIHQGVNPAHHPVVDEYLEAVSEAVSVVRSRKTRGVFNPRTY